MVVGLALAFVLVVVVVVVVECGAKACAKGEGENPPRLPCGGEVSLYNNASEFFMSPISLILYLSECLKRLRLVHVRNVCLKDVDH
jgi:hypothetical protein